LDGIGNGPAAIRRGGAIRGSEKKVEAVMRAGYTTYFVAILGFWKVLGGIALLAPRLPLLKGWARGGAFFDLTGAAASHAVSGSASGHVVATIVLAALAVISWPLRSKFSSPSAPLRRRKET
jgi:hypothetical protein